MLPILILIFIQNIPLGVIMAEQIELDTYFEVALELVEEAGKVSTAFK